MDKMVKWIKDIQKVMIESYLSDIDMIPDFINIDSMEHNMCRDISKDILLDIMTILDIKFLTDIQIQKLFDNIAIGISEIMNIDKKIALLYYSHIKNILIFYQSYSEEMEIFEISNNIQKLLILLK